MGYTGQVSDQRKTDGGGARVLRLTKSNATPEAPQPVRLESPEAVRLHAESLLELERRKTSEQRSDPAQPAARVASLSAMKASGAEKSPLSVKRPAQSEDPPSEESVTPLPTGGKRRATKPPQPS